MQVNLQDIITAYRAQLAETNHQLIVYKIAVGALETENAELKSRIESGRADIPDEVGTHVKGEEEGPE